MTQEEKVKAYEEALERARNYHEGHTLDVEWCGGEYTGREITADVTYILSDEQFVKEGYVVMSIQVTHIKS